MYKVGIITASDKGSQGLREDKGGPAIREILGGFPEDFEVTDYRVIPDEKVRLTSAMIDMADNRKIDLIVTTGRYGVFEARCDSGGYARGHRTPHSGNSGSHEKHQPRHHHARHALESGSRHSRRHTHHQSSGQPEGDRGGSRTDSAVHQARSRYPAGKRFRVRPSVNKKRTYFRMSAVCIPS